MPIVAAVVITAAATLLMSFVGFRLGHAVAGRLAGCDDRLASAALTAIGAALLGHLI